MTAQDIQHIIGKTLVLAGQPLVCRNVSWLLTGEADMIGATKAGFVTEYEVKISRQDFKRDRLKRKDARVENIEIYKDRLPNFFYYVTPGGMVTVAEVPEYAGLYFAINGKLVLQKKAPKLSDHKHDLLKIFTKVTRLYQEREFLGCCRMTYENKKGREKKTDAQGQTFKGKQFRKLLGEEQEFTEI